MKLRVYRTFDWVISVPLSQVSIGGKPPYKLQATDTLQQFNEGTQEWTNIEVVEAGKPPHPNEPTIPSVQGFTLIEGLTEIFGRVKPSEKPAE
jgi:hypothetical protein